MKQTELVIRSVDELIPYINNARTHSDEQVLQVASSIKEFGFLNPVIISNDNGILAGHCRVLAAKKLGLANVPCILESHLIETQKKAYILADNKLAENSGWDDNLVKLELKALSDADFDLDIIGFDLSEIDLEDTQNTNIDETEVPEPPVRSVTKTGDLWFLGEHRLMCGDSTSFEDTDKLLDGEAGKVDLYITDPPYNVNYQGRTDDALTIQNDSMDDDSFRRFLTDAFSVADSVLKPGGVFYIWHASLEGYNFFGACRDVQWVVRQCLIWVKNRLVFGRQDYQWRHEPCLYGWKSGEGHNWYSDRSQTTILEFDKPSRNGEHPTMKPVELFQYQIENSSKKGDIVFDAFGGSGTTLIACEQIKRKERLMELDPKYCDVIIKRWQNLTGKEAVRDDGIKFNELNDG